MNPLSLQLINIVYTTKLFNETAFRHWRSDHCLFLLAEFLITALHGSGDQYITKSHIDLESKYEKDDFLDLSQH